MRRLSAACLGLLAFAAVADVSGAQAPSENRTRPSSYIGCLRAGDNGTFALTEVGGPDVPESRSWRSLFMTTERVLDVEPTRDIDLSRHQGQTVRMTGRLEGRTLHVGSVTFVGATCK